MRPLLITSEKSMVMPSGNVTSEHSRRTRFNKPHEFKHSVKDAKEPKVVRYVRRTRPQSASSQRQFGLEYSYNALNTVRRRFSLIPSFPDTEWELDSCLQCSEQKDSNEGKHDGISGEHLRPLLSLWKFVGDRKKTEDKGSVKNSIQRHCGCVVRTSRRSDLNTKDSIS
jgi:hypothetical protein